MGNCCPAWRKSPIPPAHARPAAPKAAGALGWSLCGPIGPGGARAARGCVREAPTPAARVHGLKPEQKRASSSASAPRAVSKDVRAVGGPGCAYLSQSVPRKAGGPSRHRHPPETILT